MLRSTTQSWVSSPLGFNILAALLKGSDSNAAKYTEISKRLASKNEYKMRNKAFCSPSFKIGEHLNNANLETEQVDLADKKATDKIKRWINQQELFKGFSGEKINLSDSPFALTNISTFQASWKRHTTDGQLMTIINSFNYTEDNVYVPRFLELPFEDEELQLVVVVPNVADQLYTLAKRLSNEGLAAAHASIQPVFNVKSKLAAPNLIFSSETELNLAQVPDGLTDSALRERDMYYMLQDLSCKEGVTFDGTAYQYGDMSIDDKGVLIHVLTCLHSTKNKPAQPMEKEEVPQKNPPYFFAVVYKDTPIFIGQYIDHKTPA